MGYKQDLIANHGWTGTQSGEESLGSCHCITLCMSFRYNMCESVRLDNLSCPADTSYGTSYKGVG